MRIFKYFLFAIVLINLGCEKLDNLSHESSKKRIVSRIKSKYEGVIVEKYSTRDTPPTHIKIKTSENDIISISPNESIVDYVEIGDSIFKIKNENIAIIKRNGTKNTSFFYIKIPNAIRNDKDFPKEWKNKWMESTLR